MKMQNKEIVDFLNTCVSMKKKACQFVWHMRSKRTWQQFRRLRQLTLRNGKN